MSALASAVQFYEGQLLESSTESNFAGIEYRRILQLRDDNKAVAMHIGNRFNSNDGTSEVIDLKKWTPAKKGKNYTVVSSPKAKSIIKKKKIMYKEETFDIIKIFTDETNTLYHLILERSFKESYWPHRTFLIYRFVSEKEAVLVNYNKAELEKTEKLLVKKQEQLRSLKELGSVNYDRQRQREQEREMVARRLEKKYKSGRDSEWQRIDEDVFRLYGIGRKIADDEKKINKEIKELQSKVRSLQRKIDDEKNVAAIGEDKNLPEEIQEKLVEYLHFEKIQKLRF
jgi:hypothetical protein